jgi:acyl-CoA thioester hydrolase
VQVAQWLERRFKLEYQVFNMDGVLVATGHEWRAWAQVLPEGRLKGAAIAEGFRQRLEGNGAV